jgi:hypothetical protein
MKKIIALTLWLIVSFSLHAQNGPNGRYYPPPANIVNPVYHSLSCNPGNITTSPVTCTLSIPAGGSFIGIIPLNGVTATLGTVTDSNSDTFTVEPVYTNGSAYEDYVFYFCGFPAAITSITIPWTGSSSFSYVSGLGIYGTNTVCFDGLAQHQSTSATTAYTTVGGSPATVTPTTPGDLMLGLSSNNCGGTYTAGNDTQGNSYTLQVSNNGVSGIETFSESTIAAFGATFTGPSCRYNIYAFAVKGYTTQNGSPLNWASNGKNYQNAAAPNGKFYGSQFVSTGLIDFGVGGTNGATPTATTLLNSSIGTVTTSGNISIAAMGTTAAYTNALQPVVLGVPAAISSVNYDGIGGLGYGGTTTSGGTGVGIVSFENLTGAGASVTVGYDVYTNCPYTIGTDCGAQGGLYGGTSYSVSHLRQFGSYPYMSVVMENHEGGTIIYNPLPNQSSLHLRVNVQMNTSGNSYMVVCDPNNRFLYNWTMTAATNAASIITVGVSGEEPTTAGYNFRYWNYVWNASGAGFKLNGPCF